MATFLVNYPPFYLYTQRVSRLRLIAHLFVPDFVLGLTNPLAWCRPPHFAKLKNLELANPISNHVVYIIKMGCRA